jgi:hypothetical protein
MTREDDPREKSTTRRRCQKRGDVAAERASGSCVYPGLIFQFAASVMFPQSSQTPAIPKRSMWGGGVTSLRRVQEKIPAKEVPCGRHGLGSLRRPCPAGVVCTVWALGASQGVDVSRSEGNVLAGHRGVRHGQGIRPARANEAGHHAGLVLAEECQEALLGTDAEDHQEVCEAMGACGCEGAGGGYRGSH